MMKCKKFIILFLALILISSSLCGCGKLDSMREAQAFWTYDGSIDSITYNGVEYKRIPDYNVPNPLYNVNDYAKSVFVTEYDVPVLLSQNLSDFVQISEDKNFIYGNFYNVDVNYDWYGSQFPGCELLFCKAEIYDDLMNKLSEGIEYNMYGMGYYTYDEKYGGTIWDYYYFTQEQIIAINNILSEVKPVEDDGIELDQSYICDIDKITEDKYFGKNAFEVYVNEKGTYYLIKYTNSLELYKSYEVPQKYNELFDELKELAWSEEYTTVIYD